MRTSFLEPSQKELQALRGKIQPSRVTARNDCDTGICNSCNCNCDDTYGRRAKAILAEREVYHSLRIKTLFLDPNLADQLRAFQGGLTLDAWRRGVGGKAEDLEPLLTRLREESFLVPVLDDEGNDLQCIREECTTTPSIIAMYVMLTNQCNFACQYCFVECPLPKHHEWQTMDATTARQSIDWFAHWSDPTFYRSIIFCGGEPLLNREALVAGLERTNELVREGQLSDNLKLQLITNGSLVDRELVSIARAYGLKVSVSIDGKPGFHDIARRTLGGEDTYRKATRGYQLLRNANVPVGISMTIGQHIVGHLLENVRWLVEELDAKSIGFNMLMDVDPNSPVSREYAESINDEMIESFRYLRELGVYEDRIMRKVESFAEQTPYLHDCSGCGHQIVVTPDARVGVCHGYAAWQKYFVKPTDGFDPRKHPYWNEWVRRSPINMAQCFDCEALGICGGGCGCSADVRRGSMWCINDTFCVHSRRVLRWMLEETYAQLRGASI